MRLEGAGRLVHQRDAVGEEQHALHPAGAHQQVDQRDHRARLAGAGRHDQQRLALAVLLEMLGDRADGAVLVGPLDDLAVDRSPSQLLAAGAALDQQLQLVALVEAADLARRIARVVPDPVLVAVGIEDHRPLAVARLQPVGIELGLLLALRARPCACAWPRPGRAACRRRPTARSRRSRRPRCSACPRRGTRDRPACRAPSRPRAAAGRCSGRGSRPRCSRALSGCASAALRAAATSARSLFSSSSRFCLSASSLVSSPFLASSSACCALRWAKAFFSVSSRRESTRGVEGEAVGRLALARIGARQPEADVEQLLHRAGGVAGADRPLLVHRAVAQRVDVFRLGEHRLARRAAEARLVQQRGDIVLIGQLQAGIVAERPLDRDLDRLAGEERRRRRRHARLTLRLHRRLVHGRKFGGEEGEVGHGVSG